MCIIYYLIFLSYIFKVFFVVLIHVTLACSNVSEKALRDLHLYAL